MDVDIQRIKWNTKVKFNHIEEYAIDMSTSLTNIISFKDCGLPDYTLISGKKDFTHREIF